MDNVVALHKKFGDVVRISPNEVSFISGESAWQDIYGFRVAKHKGELNMPKDVGWYAKPPKVHHILTADDPTHSRYRKVLTNAFSERALAKQEPLLQRYADLLIMRLKEVTATDKASQDVTKWYNWTTFGTVISMSSETPRVSRRLRLMLTHDDLQISSPT